MRDLIAKWAQFTLLDSFNVVARSYDRDSYLMCGKPLSLLKRGSTMGIHLGESRRYLHKPAQVILSKAGRSRVNCDLPIIVSSLFSFG